MLQGKVAHSNGLQTGVGAMVCVKIVEGLVHEVRAHVLILLLMGLPVGVTELRHKP